MTPVSTSPLAKAVIEATRSVVGDAARIQLHEPTFNGREVEYVTECIETGWVSSVGAYVNRFEEMIAEAAGTAYGVATMNGTAALHVAMLLAGVQRGDEVLAPALTFIATINAIAYAGATPHFVDSCPETFGVDPVALDAYLATIAQVRDGVCHNRKTGAVIRAVCPMHVFGRAVDMDSLNAVAERWGLEVVEDAAEALGSFYKGRRCGGLSKIAAFSFNGNKVATTGGGGAITTNDPQLAAKAKHLTTTARVQHGWAFIHDEVGFNYRLPNINAALGCAQLETLGKKLDRKRRLFNAYEAAFASVEGAKIAIEPSWSDSNRWLVPLLLDSPDEAARDDLLTALNDAGLMARPVWTLMHRLPMYADCPRMALPIAQNLEARIINLPSSPFLDRS